MIPRRTLVTGGALSGALSALIAAADASAEPAAAPPADVTDETLSRIVQALNNLRSDVNAAVQSLRSFSEIAPVRDAQLTHLRANGKFPDYIEVGSAIWFAAYDWHVRWQQPLAISRDNTGRYTIVVNQTVLILRVEATPNFISVPYDNQ